MVLEFSYVCQYYGITVFLNRGVSVLQFRFLNVFFVFSDSRSLFNNACELPDHSFFFFKIEISCIFKISIRCIKRLFQSLFTQCIFSNRVHFEAALQIEIIFRHKCTCILSLIIIRIAFLRIWGSRSTSHVLIFTKSFLILNELRVGARNIS